MLYYQLPINFRQQNHPKGLYEWKVRGADARVSKGQEALKWYDKLGGLWRFNQPYKGRNIRNLILQFQTKIIQPIFLEKVVKLCN